MLFSGTLENIKGYSFIKEKKYSASNTYSFLNKGSEKNLSRWLNWERGKRKPTNGFMCKILDS